MGKEMKIFAVLFLIFGFMTCNVNATLISVNEQQDITSIGQGFLFEFDNLVNSDGTSGSLVFGASGDYDNNNLDENVLVSIGSLGSFLMNATGLLSNNIAGLTLTPSGFSNVEIKSKQDNTFEAIFDVSSLFLFNLLSSGNFDVVIQNGSGVNDVFNTGTYATDADYVSFNLSYNSATLNAVSVSSSSPTIVLLMSCIMLLGSSRRR
jgi:hypothetical protein